MTRRQNAQATIGQDNFLSGLQAWVDEDAALEGERESRAEAMQRMIGARQNKSTELRLNGLGLSSLPTQIGELTDLRSLDLSGNQLTELPESIGDLTALTTLGLNDNRLRTLPERIGDLTCKNWSRCLHNQNVFTRIYVVVFLVFGSKYSSNFS